MEVKRSTSDILGTWITDVDKITFDDDYFETIEDDGLTMQFNTGANYSFIPVSHFDKFKQYVNTRLNKYCEL